MKKLSTKTVATLTVVTAAAAAIPGISKVVYLGGGESQFDKLLQRHDRKYEIRADLLGISPYDLRKQLRRATFEDIIKKSGMTPRTFRMALLGKFRNELRMRGWTTARINDYIESRMSRTLTAVYA